MTADEIKRLRELSEAAQREALHGDDIIMRRTAKQMALDALPRLLDALEAERARADRLAKAAAVLRKVQVPTSWSDGAAVLVPVHGGGNRGLSAGNIREIRKALSQEPKP